MIMYTFLLARSLPPTGAGVSAAGAGVRAVGALTATSRRGDTRSWRAHCRQPARASAPVVAKFGAPDVKIPVWYRPTGNWIYRYWVNWPSSAPRQKTRQFSGERANLARGWRKCAEFIAPTV